MKHVQKTVLLWYLPAEMYALVTDVSRYPEFLPWCNRAEVLERSDEGLVARLGISMAGLRQHFTTRNRHVPDQRVEMSLVDGPFSMLEGLWTFEPVGPAGQPPQACKVTFSMRYDFASRALAAIVSPAFDRIASTLVDAFVQRAEQIHGPR